jgi:hypothetical protein
LELTGKTIGRGLKIYESFKLSSLAVFLGNIA